MSNIRILIVEDELIIAEDIRTELVILGYDVTGIATTYEEALEMFNSDNPDLVLVDIVLPGERDGVDLARTIRRRSDLPLIFLTSHADKSTVERAKLVKPDAYLTKPFEQSDLYTSIEIAFFNYVNKKAPELPDEGAGDKNNFIFKDSIFIKKDYLLIKVRFEEILWFKSDGNYIELHCGDKTHLVRSSIREFITRLPSNIFLQTHKSFAVNLNHIDSIDHTTVYIGREEIPIGRTYLPQVKRVLNIEL